MVFVYGRVLETIITIAMYIVTQEKLGLGISGNPRAQADRAFASKKICIPILIAPPAGLKTIIRFMKCVSLSNRAMGWHPTAQKRRPRFCTRTVNSIFHSKPPSNRSFQTINKVLNLRYSCKTRTKLRTNHACASSKRDLASNSQLLRTPGYLALTSTYQPPITKLRRTILPRSLATTHNTRITNRSTNL